jgi:N-terminal domain of anti-restriction factor ArdC
MNAERKALERGGRRDRRVREAAELLEAGVQRILDGEEFKRYLAFAARFHRYSANNSLLILLQRPNATRVAGYKRWQDLGWQVQRGEEGIRILAPIFRTLEDEVSGEKTRILCSFKVVKVFDVSQTVPVSEAGPLPEKPRPAALTGNSPAARAIAQSLARLLRRRGARVARERRRTRRPSPWRQRPLLLTREADSPTGDARRRPEG